MFTIHESIENELEIKKSRFITKLYKVYKVEDVEEILQQLRETYAFATHICYAYKIEDNAKFSDDGEPGGTAGLPMMEVLIKNKMDYILAVVIRIFGGIKLGSGGLVRAYSKSVSEPLKRATLKELVQGYEIQIVCSYENSKKLAYQLKNVPIIKKEYLELVTYVLQVDSEMLKDLQEWNPVVMKHVLIEKELQK